MLLCFSTVLLPLQAGSNDALMDFKVDNAFGSVQYKVNTIGTQETIGAYARIGFILDDNQLLFLGKGGAISNADLFNPTPSPYLMGYEFIGYEYLLDFGLFLDLGLALEVGGLVLGDGTTTATGGSAEATLFAVINISQNIKLQIGLGQRYSFLDADKLTAMGLKASDVDKTYYSMSLDIGGF